MNRPPFAHGSGRRRATLVQRAVFVATLVGLIVGMLPFGAVQAGTTVPAAGAGGTPALDNPTSDFFLEVIAARANSDYGDGSVSSGDPVAEYQWLIVRDDSGDTKDPETDCFPDTNPDYPDGCDWPSIHSVRGGTTAVDQIVASGSQDNLGPSISLGMDLNDQFLPDGKYLISVLAEGNKIDGAHFEIPMEGTGPGLPGVVTVAVHPYPLPLSTVRIKVFNDHATVNGQWDELTEEGLAGFKSHLSDVLGEVTTDWYGNPLCTEYDAIGDPIPGTGGACVSDADGNIVIPNMGPNRYSVTVVPPTRLTIDDPIWVQTTTLEGAHDWDTWVQENSLGFDTEIVVGGEPVPEVPFGFSQVMDQLNGAATGAITGVATALKTYVPPGGGIGFGGEAGSREDGPVSRPWVALNDLTNGDFQVYLARGATDGSFTISNVPDGDYSITVWDGPQELLLQETVVSVRNGETVDLGHYYLSYWFSHVAGTVFIDTNANGRLDAGEHGFANQTLTLRSRDNSLQDQGSAVATTDLQGRYSFRQAYPLGQWVVLESYNDLYYTTGMTYQTDNQPSETTVQTASVDVATFNLVGLSTRIDIGILPYAPGENGGIVGTVSYDVTRNELDARLSAVEDYQPSISGLDVNLYLPVACPEPLPDGAECDASGTYLLAADGSYARSALVNQYVSETWERPTDCVSRDVYNDPQSFPWTPTKPHAECLEGFAMGNQVGLDFPNVNGNYGFGDGCFMADGSAGQFDPAAGDCSSGSLEGLVPGDYLVEVVIPNDEWGRPKYQVTKEEDLNVFTGDQFVPQYPPAPCAGALHTVHVVADRIDANWDPADPRGTSGVYNPDFLDAGGSPYEGFEMPLCDVKLISLGDRRSTAPSFNLFTTVPAPGRFWGIVTDDLALSTNPRELFIGEKAGIPHMPIGLYDWSGRLVYTMETDFNGAFEVVLPSVSSYNCPLPAGPCPNVYRFVANDPGIPGAPNANYQPAYRVIATNFQLWPGLTLPADLAPLPISSLIEGPGTQNNHPPECGLATTVPQLYRVSRPYTNGTSASARTIDITGANFGAVQGTGRVSLDGVDIPPGASTTPVWTDTAIRIIVPGSVANGPHQLLIRNSAGGQTINGLTIHVRGGSYNPTLREVGPGHTYATIQAALDAAAGGSGNTSNLVVVYPGTPGAFNPLGAYYENVVLHSRAKLQGVGPGSMAANVPGSIIDGSGFNTLTDYADTWRDFVGGLGRAGNQSVYEGEVVYVVPRTTSQFTSSYPVTIDGFTIQGGNQLEFPAGINDTGGGGPINPVEGDVGVPITQGGGIFANSYAHYLRVTNNVLEGNGGSYGGAVRLGTPGIGSDHNDHVLIARNRILHNGGTNLGGAIAMFNGSDSYEVSQNDICGNFSTEYGGAISAFGLSPNGSIHDNRIYFNGAYDEGGAILIAGEPSANPATVLSAGSGPVSIHRNVIQANVSNDDGGGIRILEAGNFPISIVNNMIVNNVATHEGGGIAIDDAPDTRIVNNTIMKNLTTATSAASDGLPAPAGLADSDMSALLYASLPPGHATFNDPVQFNNIFFDNRAGTWDSTTNTLSGIGLGGPSDVEPWDMGVVGGGELRPTNSTIEDETPGRYVADASNVTGPSADPAVVDPFEVTIRVFPWVGNPAVVGLITIAVDVPNELMGDYHLVQPSTASPAHNGGAATKAGVFAPSDDIDADYRPADGGFEIGADEDPGGIPDNLAPLVSGLAFAPPSPVVAGTVVTLTGTATDAGRGDSIIVSAEWRDGSSGSWHAMSASDGAFDEIVEPITAAIDTTGWSSGNHSVQVRATDFAGNVSGTVSITLNVTVPDLDGPVVALGPYWIGFISTLGAVVTDVGHGGSDIAAAEWFEGVVAPGSGHPMSASIGGFNSSTEIVTASINTAGWTPGVHILQVRARDAAGNWGPASGGAAVTINGAGLATIVPNGVTADTFATGLGMWERVVGGANITVSDAAALDGVPGLALTLHRKTKAFLVDTDPDALKTYHARFLFDPNGARTGRAIQTLFLGRSTTGKAVFEVQYRHRVGAGYQVRLVTRGLHGTVVGRWVGIGNQVRTIEVAWSTGRRGGARLFIDGQRVSRLVVNSRGLRLDQVRLGLVKAMKAGSGTEYIDGFVSSETAKIGM